MLVQSAALNEPSQYRVYRIAVPDAEQQVMKTTRHPGGKVLIIEPEDGTSTTPSTEADDAPPDPPAMGTPPGEHSSELPGDNDGEAADGNDSEMGRRGSGVAD